MELGGVNLVAIVIAALASMIVGMIYFSPALFGNLWMRLSKISKSDIKRIKVHGLNKNYFASFISTAITAYVLSLFIKFSGVIGVVGGISIGVLAWLGFVATTLLGGVLWDRRPVQLYLLNNFYQLISFVLMSIILSLWG